MVLPDYQLVAAHHQLAAGHHLFTFTSRKQQDYVRFFFLLFLTRKRWKSTEMPALSSWIIVCQIHIFGKNPQPFSHFSLDSQLTFKQDFWPGVTSAHFNLEERRN